VHEAEDVVALPDGIRVTSAPRTAVDLARYVDDPTLLAAMDQIVLAGLCQASTILRVADRLSTPRRRWARRAAALLAGHLPDGLAESTWEARVWTALEAAGVTGMHRNVWLTIPGYGRVRLDIAVAAIRWAVEIDVHPHHVGVAGTAKDKARDRATHSIGWQVDRVSHPELRHDFDATIRSVVSSYERRRADITSMSRLSRG
jgi:very-short-patch-repair endonuclease